VTGLAYASAEASPRAAVPVTNPHQRAPARRAQVPI